MYYTIYKTTNIITGEFYVGQHVTPILDDGYLGSGAGIIENVLKYDKKNFTKEILYIYDNETDMNNKEIELVTSEFLENPLVLNRQLGGSGGWFVRKSIVVFENGKWRRIRSSSYDPNIHMTPTSGNIRVFDITMDCWRRIPTSEYHKNKEIYKTASTAKVSIIELDTNTTKSILLSEFNPQKHKKVFGGIVAELEGKMQYVSRQKFDELSLVGCNKDKVTVVDKNSGIRKHVTRDEFKKNRNQYLANTEGYVTVFDTQLGNYAMISKYDFRNDPARYKGTTSGQRTVWDISKKTFMNIPKETFDRKYHRLASDKKILCYNFKEELIIEFWGSKLDFIKLYGAELYNQALKQTKNYQPKHRKKYSKYVGCNFILVDWRNENE